ncbi:MAG: HAD family phosphatase [Clostridia bacterium]|nr:HAD family phosphatase [Clostridia bacterium]
MIKQIVFDCNGVLSILDFDTYITGISSDPAHGQLIMEKLWVKGSPWLEYDRGLHTKAEMVDILNAYLPEIPKEVFKTFLDGWASNLMPIDGMEEIVKELCAAGYPCYLLSNFNEQFEEIRPNNPVLEAMDGEVISYHIDMLKPDREIFDHAAEKFGIDPAETLFVDDTLVNVKGAIAAGYQAYHFTTAEDFREGLRNLKVLH